MLMLLESVRRASSESRSEHQWSHPPFKTTINYCWCGKVALGALCEAEFVGEPAAAWLRARPTNLFKVLNFTLVKSATMEPKTPRQWQLRDSAMGQWFHSSPMEPLLNLLALTAALRSAFPAPPEIEEDPDPFFAEHGDQPPPSSLPEAPSSSPSSPRPPHHRTPPPPPRAPPPPPAVRLVATLEDEEDTEAYYGGFRALREAFGTDFRALASSLAQGPVVDANDVGDVTSEGLGSGGSSPSFGFGGGLSGARFYATSDGRFCFKSLKSREVRQLRLSLGPMAAHVNALRAPASASGGDGGGVGGGGGDRRKSRSLLPPLLALVCVRTGQPPTPLGLLGALATGGGARALDSDLYLVAMPNVFGAPGLTEAYDIKGTGCDRSGWQSNEGNWRTRRPF